MPELPEIENIISLLHDLEGKRLQVCSIIGNHKVVKNVTQTELCLKLEGSVLTGITRRGKWIVLTFTICADTYNLYIHNSIYGTIVRHPKSSGISYHKNDRFALMFTDVRWEQEDRTLITYRDPRCWGQIHLYDGHITPPFLKKESLDALEVTSSLYRDSYCRYPRQALGDLMLRQDLIAGIGNIYRAEILHAAHISPFRFPPSVSDWEWTNLAFMTKVVLERAIAAGGSSISTYKLPDGSSGHAQQLHRVYKRQGQNCDYCLLTKNEEHRIRVEMLTKRKIFFCEECQH